MKMLAKELEKKKETQFLLQFKEAIQAISSALNTGYSVENAVREAKKDLQLIYTEEDRISKELAVMVRNIRLQIPIEQIFQELADQVQTEDVRSFVTVFGNALGIGVMSGCLAIYLGAYYLGFKMIEIEV